MSNYLDLPVRDGKVILQTVEGCVRKIKIRKDWKCYYCNNTVDKGSDAIEQTVSTPKGGGGMYKIHLHPHCCLIKIRTEENNRVYYKEVTL